MTVEHIFTLDVAVIRKCDFLIINKKDKTPLYRQIYMSVRKSNETGSLKKGTKLPSIRRLSTDLDVSKTTVNGAYEQLCAEGYISNRPRSGYYVDYTVINAFTAEIIFIVSFCFVGI